MMAWVLDGPTLDHLCEAIATAVEVVIDLENTGLNEYETGKRREWPCSARVALASLTLPQPDQSVPTTWVVPLSHPDSPFSGQWRKVLTRIARAVKDAGASISNHNLKYDLRWIRAHTGIDLSSQTSWDTQISSHLLDETSGTALKERAPATFGVERWDDFDLSTPGAAEKVPLFDLGTYAARDTYWTWRLAEHHRQQMGVGEYAYEPEGADEVEAVRLGQLAVWCAMPTSATLTALEQRGIGLDVEWTIERLKAAREAEEEALALLVDRYPGCSDREPSFAPTSIYFRDWTEAAVEADDLRVTAMTGTGQPQWNKSALTRQARAGFKVAQMLLDYRAATKAQEFLNSWLRFVTPGGRIHATYHAGRVVTGRLSCSDPNMQQVTKSLKPAFIPRPGYLIADLDYSQIELRAAAFIARCEPMLQAFREGQDLHRLLASQITEKDPGDVDDEERQAGKSANFGLLYGMSADGFREYAEDVYGVFFTDDEAAEVRDAFFTTWEGMADWHDKMIRRAERTGQVVSPIGRVRRVPAIHDGNGYLRGRAERQAINSPVQSFASDMMQMAAASIEGNLPGHSPVPGARLVGTVHDSILVEVPEGDWKRTAGRCMRRMLDLDPVLQKMGCELDVPLAVEARIGTRWGLADIGTIR